MPNPAPVLNLQSEVFTALAHPTRLQILDLLREGEACVCHIQAMLDQRQAYVSQHLNVLRNAGLVTSRKEGLRVYYQASHPRLFSAIDEVRAFLLEAEMELSIPEQESHPQQPCHCPQCVEKKSLVQTEASHA